MTGEGHGRVDLKGRNPVSILNTRCKTVLSESRCRLGSPRSRRWHGDEDVYRGVTWHHYLCEGVAEAGLTKKKSRHTTVMSASADTRGALGLRQAVRVVLCWAQKAGLYISSPQSLDLGHPGRW